MKKGLLLSFLLATTALSAQTTVASKTKAHVEYLASDRLEGREAGTPSERLAGDYIAAQLARVGANPLPGHADMFEPFEFTAGSRDGGSTINGSRDGIQALSFSDDATVSGPVVF